MKEPTRWRDLQQEALDETDPKRLIDITDELIRLLTAHEKRVAGTGAGRDIESLESSTDDAS